METEGRHKRVRDRGKGWERRGYEGWKGAGRESVMRKEYLCSITIEGTPPPMLQWSYA